MKRWTMMLAALLLMVAVVPGTCEQATETGNHEKARKDSEMMLALASGGYFDMNDEALNNWKTYEEYEKTYAELKNEAVMDFQKDHDLPQTGELDEKTMETLIPDYEECRKQEAMGNLAVGCTSENVWRLQVDLQALGCYAGDATGHFGMKTRAAVLAYQKAEGLTEDGFVTPELLEAIHDQAQEKP